MDKLKVSKDAVPVEAIIAWYLFKNPGKQVLDGDTYFVYHKESTCFLYRKPTNKIRNGWSIANGMRSWFEQALRLDL